MQQREQQREQRGTTPGTATERLRRHWKSALVAALAVATLSVALVACGGGTSSGGTPSGSTSNVTNTPFGSGNTTPSGSSTFTPPVGFPTTAPTATGEGGTRGSSDACQLTPTPSTNDISVPSDVPVYSGAQLVVHTKVQSNTQPPIPIGEFDFCAVNSSASPIASYYADQLPKSGWQNVQTYTSGSISLVATKGSSSNQTTITVTVLQDLNPGFSGDVEIIISINNCASAECG